MATKPATEKSASAQTIQQFEDAAAVDKSRSGMSTVSSGFKLDNVRIYILRLHASRFYMCVSAS